MPQEWRARNAVPIPKQITNADSGRTIKKSQRQMRHDLGDRRQRGHTVTVDQQLLLHTRTGSQDSGGRVAQQLTRCRIFVIASAGTDEKHGDHE